MLFNSYIFIFLFLPLAFAGYFLLNYLKRYELGKCWLIGMSLWFYGYFNWSYLLILMGSILINYLFFHLQNVCGKKSKVKLKKFILAAAMLVNIGSIFYYKYFDFFIDNINQWFHMDIPFQNILLPLGISFFTFQQISFQIDTYRGKTSKYGFVDYVLFVSFFPQLVAGPIVLHDEMIPQFADLSKKRIDIKNAAHGIALFVLGLGKKVLIADVFGCAVDAAYKDVWKLNAPAAILIMLAYTFQIYFDFSGYCDMARGLGEMFNITIPINFNSPYKAQNVAQFWERWHITLSRFFREYLYIPLGGNRKGTITTYLNHIVVFLISGLWHGANWTFILWGAMHGLGIVFAKATKKAFSKVPKVICWFVTFVFINLTWILFRADSIALSLSFLKRFTIWQGSIWDCGAIATFDNIYKLIIYFATAFVLSVICPNANQICEKMKYRTFEAIGIAIIFVVSVLSLSNVSSFLYFNF